MRVLVGQTRPGGLTNADALNNGRCSRRKLLRAIVARLLRR